MLIKLLIILGILFSGEITGHGFIIV